MTDGWHPGFMQKPYKIDFATNLEFEFSRSVDTKKAPPFLRTLSLNFEFEKFSCL